MISILYSIFKKPFYFGFGWLSSFFERQKSTESFPIDFVVTWVDNNDQEWRKAKKVFEKDYSKISNGDERYRDWDNFKYWFRSVEKYAPWVNKVYLVTCGHFPAWLNLNHPKLVLVKHSDYMDSNYLPTFSSIPIELNFHKIDGLSEHFVYFNDDIFLTKNVKPSDFFKNGEPKICSESRPIINTPVNDPFYHQLFSMVGLMNKYDWIKTIEFSPRRWFSHKLGFHIINNWETYKHGYLTGFYYTHLAQGFRKSTFNKVWDIFGKNLNESSLHKFRESRDVNHWLYTLHEIKDGTYTPVSRYYMGRHFANVSRDINIIREAVQNNRYKMICINDNENIKSSEFEMTKKNILEILAKAFPEKSSYEV